MKLNQQRRSRATFAAQLQLHLQQYIHRNCSQSTYIYNVYFRLAQKNKTSERKQLLKEHMSFAVML